jgi:dinuclear metal center YbgI/SA1388 family protein
MAKVQLAPLAAYCNRLLSTDQVRDYDGAVNGLQVANSGAVTRIAAAVDASLATLQLAADAGADLLLVHHGLFWGPTHPWTGKRHAMLRLLIERDLAVYSSHLPLDIHPKLGNNAQLCAALGFRKLAPFFFEKEQATGYRTRQKLSRVELAARLERVVGGRVTVLPGGPERCTEIGVVTGGAGNQLKKAASEGVDTFITGEGAHWTYALAEELGINVFYAGHYATETFGVKALAEHLSQKFRVPWTFVDHPTGL